MRTSAGQLGHVPIAVILTKKKKKDNLRTIGFVLSLYFKAVRLS